MSIPDQETLPEPVTDAGEGSRQAAARNIGLGAIWNVGAYLLPQFMTLALSVVVARKLGPAQQGVISYLTFIAATVGTIFGLGLPSAIEQAISQYTGEGKPQLVRAFGLWAARSTVLPALASFLTVLGIGRLQYTSYSWAWLAAALVASMVTVHAVAAQGLNGLHEFRIPSGIGVAAQLITSTVCLAALLLSRGVTEFIWIQAVGTVVSAALTMRAFVRHLPPHEARVPRRERDLASRAALRFAAVSGIVVLLETIVARRSEFVFLAAFHHDKPNEIAYYSVAFAAAVAVATVPAALVSVAMPVVSRLLASGDHERVRDGYHSAQKFILVISAPAAGGLIGCGQALVLLAYGEPYWKAAHLLIIVTVAPTIFGPLGALASAALLGSGNPKAAVRAQIVAATVTVVADVALIWPWASYGAAVAGGLGILAGTWSLMRQARGHLDLRPVGVDAWWNVLLTVLVVAAPGLMLQYLGMSHVVVLFGGAVLGLAAMALLWNVIQPLTPDHLAMIGVIISKLPARGRAILESFVTYEGRRRQV